MARAGTEPNLPEPQHIHTARLNRLYEVFR